MLLFHTNLSDTATLTASSTSAALAVANVQTEQARNKWRSGASTATEYIVGDMGSAKAVTAVIIHAHTLLATDTSIKFQMNSSDSWSSPAYSVDLTWADKTIAKTFAAQTYQYFRIVFTKATAASFRDIGRVFVGAYTTVSMHPDNDPEWNMIDASEVDQSVGGDEFAEVKAMRRTAKVNYSSLPETEAANLRTFFTAVGKFLPFFVQLETIAPLNEYVYARNAADLKMKQKAWGSSFRWSLSFEFREQVS